MFLKLSHVQCLGFVNSRSVIFSHISQLHQLLKTVRFFCQPKSKYLSDRKKVYVRRSLNNMYAIRTFAWSVKTKIPWVTDFQCAARAFGLRCRPRNIYVARDKNLLYLG